MTAKPNKDLARRVEAAAARLLDRDGEITYPALLMELGHLSRADLDAWRSGRAPDLERVVRANLTKLARIQTAVRRLGRDRGLVRHVRSAPGGRRFSKTGQPHVEAEYRSAYRRPEETATDTTGLEPLKEPSAVNSSVK